MRKLLFRVVVVVLCLTALLAGLSAAVRSRLRTITRTLVVEDVEGDGEAIAGHGRHGLQFWRTRVSGS